MANEEPKKKQSIAVDMATSDTKSTTVKKIPKYDPSPLSL